MGRFTPRLKLGIRPTLQTSGTPTPTPADVTAPTLSSPTGVQTGSTTATIGVTTNEANGNLYHFVSTSSTPPSVSDLKLGTGAVASGFQGIGSSGAKTASITGLTASTAYYAHWVHRDTAGNHSAISTTASFTTAADGSLPTAPVLTKTSAAGVNPMSWSGAYTDLTLDDVIRLSWTVNGGAATTETHTVTSDDLIAASEGSFEFDWTAYTTAAASFVNGDVIAVQERIERGGSNSAYSNTLTDTVVVAAAGIWTPGTAPAGQSLAFGSSTATFTSLAFGAGYAVVMVSSKERRVTGVTVGGAAATLVRENTATLSAFHISMWRCAISAGSHNVVVTGGDTFGQIAMSHGTLVTTTPTPTATSNGTYGYLADPQTTASITCPASGIIIGCFGSEAGANDPTWTNGTEETDVTAGSACRHTSGSRNTTGTLSVTGFNFAGSAWVAAAWGP